MIKLKGVLKELILILSVIAVTACTSQKIFKHNREKSSTTTIDNPDLIRLSKKMSYSDDQQEARRLNMQELLHDNIIYFDLDKYDIRAEFYPKINAHAEFLRKNPFSTVTVEGHADERGTPEYNIALGERRANAVKIYFQAQGVSDEQITIVSYGKEKPAILGHNEEVYAKNRRVVLVY